MYCKKPSINRRKQAISLCRSNIFCWRWWLKKNQLTKVLNDAGLHEKALTETIAELRKGAKVDSASAEDTYNSLNKYAINLNERARSGKLDPVIGRDEEIRRVLQILSRRTKTIPFWLVNREQVKPLLPKDWRIVLCVVMYPKTWNRNRFSRSIWALWLPVQNTKANLKNVWNRLSTKWWKLKAKSFCLSMRYIRWWAQEKAMVPWMRPIFWNLLWHVVNYVRLVQPLWTNIRNIFEKDKALERRFQIVMVDEPDTASTISILRGLKERYENHHKVRIKDDAIIAAVELSSRYITDRFCR